MSKAPERIWATYNDALGFESWETDSVTLTPQPEFGRYQEYVHIDRLEEVECRLKKAIEIARDLAYAHGKWIEEDIDYEEFYSWREDLN